MRRTIRVWLPTLFALLTLVGLGLALTNTSIGPAVFFVNGRPAPWFDGALLAAVSFLVLVFSLCGFYFPDWERRHAVLREDIVIGGQRVPALVFPYSTGVQVFIACVTVMMLVWGRLANGIFLFLLWLPVLVVLMRAVFGRQFVAVTPDGLAWRVMPPDAAQGQKPAGAQDYFTRQPIQFLPWNAVTDVSLAEVAVTVSRRSVQWQVPAKMLRVSVSDRAALDGLTSYQRVIPTDSGADVLIPLGWGNFSDRWAKFGDDETRAQPEAVWEAVDHYWRRPEERGQIGSPLGAVRLAAETEAAPAAPPPLTVVPPNAGLDPRAEAQRLGGNAVTSGQRLGGMLLGVPYFAIAYPVLNAMHLFRSYWIFSDVSISYMLVIVLPGCAVISAAMAAFAAPQASETTAARATERGYLSEVAFLALMFFGFDAWQHFILHHFTNRALPITLLITDFLLCAVATIGTCRIGLYCGRAAKTTGPAWLARWLAWWGRGLK